MAKIYSQLEKAQIENLTADPTGTGLVAGRIWYRTDTKLFKVYDGAAVQTFVDLNTAQTLVNKILTTPQVNAAAAFQEITTPAAPSAGLRKIYPKTDGWYEQNSAGVESPLGSGGGTGKNYFPTAVQLGTATTGFSGYADAAGVLPVDGTGGSPSGNFAIAASATSPLSGTSSLVISKTAANLQGEGVSIDFTLDTSDKGKVLALSMNYAVSSGTYADNDAVIMFYDVTNSVLIQPAPYQIKNHTLTSDRFFCEVQTPYNCNTLRMIIHCSSTSASAYSLKIDDLLFGPQAKLYGSVATDQTSYVPLIKAVTTNPTITVYDTAAGLWWKVGQNLIAEINVASATVASSGSGAYVFTLPPQFTPIINGEVYTSSVVRTDRCQVIGEATISGNAGTAGWSTSLNTTGQAILAQAADGSYGVAIIAGGTVVGASWYAAVTAFCNYTVRVTLPISGWSSSQLLSSDASTRVVASRYAKSGAQSIGTGANTAVTYDTKSFDKTGSFSSSTFSCPVQGVYDVSSVVEFAPNATGYRQSFLYKNGSVFSMLAFDKTPSATYASSLAGSDSVECNAGDTLAIYAYQSSGGNLNIGASGSDYNNVSFKLRQGPAQIAASESVSLQYYDTSGQSMSNALTTVQYSNKGWDSFNAWSANTFTAPVSGVYEVNALFRGSTTTSAISRMTLWYFYQSTYFMLGQSDPVNSGNQSYVVSGSRKVRMLAGQTLSIALSTNYSANIVGSTGGGENFVEITRVGNY